jgi:hypothetical protein
MLVTILVGEADGERPLARPKHTWEDNIKMHFTCTQRVNIIAHPCTATFSDLLCVKWVLLEYNNVV